MESKIVVLNRHSDFDFLKKNGRRVFPNHWMIINYLENNYPSNRYGWTVPSRIGGAVLRNKVKRWCREYLKSSPLQRKQKYDVNIIIKANVDAEEFKKVKFREFCEAMELGFNRIK